MVMITALAVLLTLNMLLLHGYKLKELYYVIYRLIIKPKFKVGELVLIYNKEYEIIAVSITDKPYTYFCVPINQNGVNMGYRTSFFIEKEIKKKTGLLKELE